MKRPPQHSAGRALAFLTKHWNHQVPFMPQMPTIVTPSQLHTAPIGFAMALDVLPA